MFYVTFIIKIVDVIRKKKVRREETNLYEYSGERRREATLQGANVTNFFALNNHCLSHFFCTFSLIITFFFLFIIFHSSYPSPVLLNLSEFSFLFNSEPKKKKLERETPLHQFSNNNSLTFLPFIVVFLAFFSFSSSPELTTVQRSRDRYFHSFPPPFLDHFQSPFGSLPNLILFLFCWLAVFVFVAVCYRFLLLFWNRFELELGWCLCDGFFLMFIWCPFSEYIWKF